jgi:hypothetical protein
LNGSPTEAWVALSSNRESSIVVWTFRLTIAPPLLPRLATNVERRMVSKPDTPQMAPPPQSGWLVGTTLFWNVTSSTRRVVRRVGACQTRSIAAPWSVAQPFRSVSFRKTRSSPVLGWGSS